MNRTDGITNDGNMKPVTVTTIRDCWRLLNMPIEEVFRESARHLLADRGDRQSPAGGLNRAQDDLRTGTFQRYRFDRGLVHRDVVWSGDSERVVANLPGEPYRLVDLVAVVLE